jgi:endonuclease YncB( thermonuclease family)
VVELAGEQPSLRVFDTWGQASEEYISENPFLLARTLSASYLATMTKFQIIACALFIICSASSAATAGADEFVGRASVIDGDTIEIGGQRIRLNGIDAPESWQTCADEKGHAYLCGQKAALALDAWLAESRPTTCRSVGNDRYGRVVADCFREDNEVVNQWLVRQGFAVDWVRYSHGEYAADQIEAKKERLGIWRGSFQLPCEVRAARQKRQPSC